MTSGSALESNFDGGATTGPMGTFAHHFNAFVGTDIAENRKDYAADAKLNFYDIGTGTLTTYIGIEGIDRAFAKFFGLSQSELEAPLVYVGGNPDLVFLGLDFGESVAPEWTDTFLFDSDGKFRVQNIVADFRCYPKFEDVSDNSFNQRMATLCPQAQTT